MKLKIKYPKCQYLSKDNDVGSKIDVFELHVAFSIRCRAVAMFSVKFSWVLNFDNSKTPLFVSAKKWFYSTFAIKLGNWGKTISLPTSYDRFPPSSSFPYTPVSTIFIIAGGFCWTNICCAFVTVFLAVFSNKTAMTFANVTRRRYI